MTKVCFNQANTLCLCLSNDLLTAADVKDLRLAKEQRFNAASIRDADGLAKVWNTPAGLNMCKICAENIITNKSDYKIDLHMLLEVGLLL